MKRNKLIKHLNKNGCELERHGGRHDQFINAATGSVSMVPRHAEIKRFTAQQICKQLGIPIKDN